MLSLLLLIDKMIDIYTWIVIASAIMSWLVAFGVINVRNQFIRVVVDLLYRLTEPLLRPDPPHPAQPGRRRHLAGHPAARPVLPARAFCASTSGRSDPLSRRPIRRSCAAPARA